MKDAHWYQLLMLFLVALIGIVLVPSSSLADNTNLQSWTWQKGIETHTLDNMTLVEMDLTIPAGEINSKGNLHNYVWAYTNTGDFLQVGIVFKDSIIPDTTYKAGSIFYSDGKLPFYFDEPYVEGHHYRFVMHFDKGWRLYVKDDVSRKESNVLFDRIHGDAIVKAGVFLESISLDSQDLVTTGPSMGTLSNIKDETLTLYANGSLVSSNAYYFETPKISEKVGVYMVNYISPPEASVFKSSGEGKYEVGFSEQEYQPTAVPEFGSLTGMVILISIITVLVILTRFRFIQKAQVL